MPRSPRLALLLALLPTAYLLAACGRESASIPAGAPLFEDVAATAGLTVAPPSGRSARFYMPEIMGSGAALFDFDGDGLLDIYLAHGRELEAAAPAATAATAGRLYRNSSALGADGRWVWRFVDVTAGSGIPAGDYGVGVATGDFDNDGRVDLYLANYGANRLLRNLGAGKFAEVTAGAGAAALADPRWSSAASFVDVDADGWLDLFIVNYLDFTKANHQICPSPAGEPDYCGPVTYQPELSRLLHNRGDGSFADRSLELGFLAHAGSGLGIVTTDADGDLRLDLVVANDKMANFLWLQRANGRFEEAALLAGCAVNIDGQAEAGMGVDAGDVDADGDEDLIFAHLAGETNTLYLNVGGAFEDQSLASGLGPPSRPFTAFGAAFFDFDRDGWLDLATANGHVHRLPHLAESGDPFPYHQRNQLFRNRGGGNFEEVAAAEAGKGFELSAIGRALAVGDLDNDGDLDLLLTRLDAPPLLLINRRPADDRWLGLRALAGNRDALGAVVRFAEKDMPLQVRRFRSDGSYAAARDPRVLLARRTAAPATVEIVWPGGARERFSGLLGGRYHQLVAGRGEAVEKAL